MAVKNEERHGDISVGHGRFVAPYAPRVTKVKEEKRGVNDTADASNSAALTHA